MRGCPEARWSGTSGLVLAPVGWPLYAAFPIAKSMQNKGARSANITIFLSTWASVKIPMVAMEAHFVGLNFALLRLGLTIPGAILIGFLLERLHGLNEGAQTP
jgi:uncharacterized membrane protein YraQ (UPF0718 family)